MFDSYWRFAAARQAVYEARLTGAGPPWTTDPVIAAHRFTNCYRAADRVSQFLIKNVAYTGSAEPDETVFRVLLFKLFNRIETWERLREEFGDLTWVDFDIDRYESALSSVAAAGKRLYSAAYVMP
ncbi:nucleotide kinase domain-containing protein, partial [Frankia sp. CpI1-P]|uniref:nucleotide kinase domain-containing protein n=1 Tax=Frankia sp. CpI1-P TaxID=1502734 RepID=UPI0037C14324